jgi:hypothetical protein
MRKTDKKTHNIVVSVTVLINNAENMPFLIFAAAFMAAVAYAQVPVTQIPDRQIQVSLPLPRRTWIGASGWGYEEDGHENFARAGRIRIRNVRVVGCWTSYPWWLRPQPQSPQCILAHGSFPHFMLEKPDELWHPVLQPIHQLALTSVKFDQLF